MGAIFKCINQMNRLWEPALALRLSSKNVYVCLFYCNTVAFMSHLYQSQGRAIPKDMSMGPLGLYEGENGWAGIPL